MISINIHKTKKKIKNKDKKTSLIEVITTPNIL